MRFDLEIHPVLTKLVFIDQGKEIPKSYLPALYLNTNEINIQPSDFISIEMSNQIDALLSMPLTKVDFNNSSFTTNSDKILLTHIVRYSKITGSKFPIFTKHTINIPVGASFVDQSIRIFNEIGAELDRDLYLVETSNNNVFIYVSELDDSILFVEWADTISSHIEMLKLEPIFKDMGADFNVNSLGTYEYCCIPDSNLGHITVHLGLNSGSLYMTNKSTFKGILPPVGNINKSWYIQFENMTLYSQTASGAVMKYAIPEYYVQKMQDALQSQALGIIYDPLYKKYTDQICKIIGLNYIKTQLPPSQFKLDNVDIKIYDKLTLKLVYGFTSNKTKIGQAIESSGILWTLIDDYSYNGIFKIPSTIDITSQYATADYYIDNIYYELRTLDLNAIITSNTLVALYVAPTYDNSDVDQNKLFYVYIGNVDNRSNSEKFKKIGASFSDRDDYNQFLSENNCLHLCYTTVETDKMQDILDTTYCVTYDNISPYLSDSDKSTYAIELFSNSLINNDIRLQLNDTAYVSIDNSIFSTSADADYINTQYIDFVKQVVNENSTISTRMLIGKDKINSLNTI
jgi:hypothetical protein